MRKLSRSDKPKSDILVRDGGKLVQQSLYQLAIYEVKLDIPPELLKESNRNLVPDGNDPVICLLNCRTSA